MKNLKCLSIKQPAVDQIQKGLKTIELRSWKTSYSTRWIIRGICILSMLKSYKPLPDRFRLHIQQLLRI